MAAAAPASSATILSSPASDTRKTPTQRFCDRWESRIDNELDPIRANRIKLWMGYARGYIKLVETGLSETIGGCIAGEGSDTVVPNPIKLAVASVEFVLDMIQNSVKTFRENLGICRANRRELEMQVAECIPLVDFKLPSKRDEVYALVVTKLDNAEAEGIVVENSRRSIRRADRARLTDRYDDAYEYLCQAYRRIGKSL